MPPPTTTAPARSTLSIGARGLRVSRPPAIDGFRQQRGEVDDLQLCVGGAHAVVEHHGAEGARDRERLGAGPGRLSHALLVDGPPAPFLHPHARAAGAAAEGPLAIAPHLHYMARGGRQLTGRLAHVVVAREVARVVIRDGALARERLETAFA